MKSCISLPPPNGEGYVFTAVAVSVCLSVCLSVSNITEKRLNGFSLNRDVPFNPLNTGFFFEFSEESVSVSNITGKRVERMFVKFLAKDGYETKNNLEYFRNVAVNSLNPGSIFLFPGSVFVSNIIEKLVNGFSCNFHEMSDTMQEITT